MIKKFALLLCLLIIYPYFLQAQGSEEAPFLHMAGVKKTFSYFATTQLADDGLELFFKTSISRAIGIELGYGSLYVPIKSYKQVSGTTITGNGVKSYDQYTFGLNHYMWWLWKNLILDVGLTYCSFNNGYIKVYDTTDDLQHFYEVSISRGENIFGVYLGFEVITEIAKGFFGTSSVRYILALQNTAASRAIFDIGLGFSF